MCRLGQPSMAAGVEANKHCERTDVIVGSLLVNVQGMAINKHALLSNIRQTSTLACEAYAVPADRPAPVIARPIDAFLAHPCRGGWH